MSYFKTLFSLNNRLKGHILLTEKVIIGDYLKYFFDLLKANNYFIEISS